MRRLQIQQKPFYKQFYVHDKILRTRNSRRKFIKNLLLEKHEENMCKPNKYDLNRDLAKQDTQGVLSSVHQDYAKISERSEG